MSVSLPYPCGTHEAVSTWERVFVRVNVRDCAHRHVPGAVQRCSYVSCCKWGTEVREASLDESSCSNGPKVSR